VIGRLPAAAPRDDVAEASLGHYKTMAEGMKLSVERTEPGPRLSLTTYWPDNGKSWDINHLTILLQHDWLHLAGAAGATLVCKFIQKCIS
jgi:hypothetical protein